MRAFITLTPVAVAVLPSLACAQAPPATPLSVFLCPQLGVAAASGDVADAWDPALSAGGEVEVPLTPLFTLSGSVFYSEFSPKLVPSGETASILELGANIKYRIAPTPTVKPYIRFGLGVYSRDTGGAETRSNFGASGGGGIDIDLPRFPVGFTASARFHKIFITSTSFQNPSWQYFNLTAGLRLRVL